jgi:acetylornithine deacetylase/succinyl-diaminopimelate desuccinylase-like protein
MRVGNHDLYWHRPLVGFLAAKTNEVELLTESLLGYFTAYHREDLRCARPVELWPRLQRRPLYLSILRDLDTPHDHYTHATSLNVINLLDVWHARGERPLTPGFARRVLAAPKHETLQQWLEALPARCAAPEAGLAIRKKLEGIIQGSAHGEEPHGITYGETARRRFEEAWWNDIRFLASGEYLNKDNADVAQDDLTRRFVRHPARDLGPLGSYLMQRHRQAIGRADMEGRALVGEQRFKWQSDFDFPIFGGWKDNQEGRTYERNILVLIPGKNRRQAVVLADHYDTAYMEDVYSKERGGTGARLSARGADDNCSATATLLQAAPIFLELSRQGRLERDVWLMHLTGEEFPSDCLGARSFCKALIEKRLRLLLDEEGTSLDLSEVEVAAVCIMDMIAHNRDDDRDVFQISPGAGAASLAIAFQAHVAAELWNAGTIEWNRRPDRAHCQRGRRSVDGGIPETALHLPLNGEVRTRLDPHSSLYNTDGQIFSDAGLPTVLFMENYDINRSGYHDTKDTMENIDLDYGAALAAIAIETLARIATRVSPTR